MGRMTGFFEELEAGFDSGPFIEFVTGIEHEGLRQLAETWTDVFLTKGGIPTREHMDPTRFPKALGRIWYLHFDRRDEEFKFILVGNEISEAMGQYPRNKPLSEVYSSDDYKLIRGFLDDSLHLPAAVYGAGMFKLASVDGARFERLCLPISSTGRDVDRVIGGTFFTAPIGGAQSLLEEEISKRRTLNLKGFGIALDF